MMEVNIVFKAPRRKVREYGRRNLRRLARERAIERAREARALRTRWAPHDSEMKKSLRGVDLDRWYA